ncbi:MAG: hypothetical protein R3B96_16205 [Pirellulaceae bacterium]
MDVGATTTGETTLPELNRLIAALGLDASYTRGEGDLLWRNLNEKAELSADLVGGYGSNLLGHGRPDLLREAVEALQVVPMLDQFSRRDSAILLSERLTKWWRELTRTRLSVFAALHGGGGGRNGDQALRVSLAVASRTMDRRDSTTSWECGA